jgi:hypothetical protein
MDRAAGARDRMVGVAARYATLRVVRRESEGARAGAQPLCEVAATGRRVGPVPGERDARAHGTGLDGIRM